MFIMLKPTSMLALDLILTQRRLLFDDYATFCINIDIDKHISEFIFQNQIRYETRDFSYFNFEEKLYYS